MDNRYVQQFKKGSLEMILLCLIGRKETYGYEIMIAHLYWGMQRRELFILSYIVCKMLN